MDERLWLTNWNKLYVKNEIHLKKAITPLYVGFKITENCNQRCRHCWIVNIKIVNFLVIVVEATMPWHLFKN